jgi:hypothetical protein
LLLATSLDRSIHKIEKTSLLPLKQTSNFMYIYS